jgi:AcrR family transcriptional regulator
MPGVQRRALIEDAAAPLFVAHGYAGTTLEDVAAAAGISRPVIYDHFASKRALHDALVERHTGELMASVASRVAEAAAEPRARLRAGFDAFFEFIEGDPYAWRMIFREPLAEGTIGVLPNRIQGTVTAGIAGLLRQAAHDANVDLGSPERVVRFAESMRWMCNGLAAWWYEQPDIDRAVLVDTVMDLCWTGLERLTTKGG